MQDPQQAQIFAQHTAAAMLPLFAIIGLMALAFYAFNVFLYWRIFTKAGMAGPLALIALLPNLGGLICNCILAFGEFGKHPAAPVYNPYPPQYPPATAPTTYAQPPAGYSPSGYPPASYPPAGTGDIDNSPRR